MANSRETHQTITTPAQLGALCQWLARVAAIGLDTEFVSESSYRPKLCLVQLAAVHPDDPASAPPRLVVIDPLVIEDLQPFWTVIARGGHQTIVHAGRQEFIFCQEATGARPARLFDLQVAAGLVGHEYPAGYNTLVTRLLGESLRHPETRTHWGARPLTDRQVAYALDDVRYLQPLRDKLQEQIDQMNRGTWLAEEMESWQQTIEEALRGSRWRRVSGSGALGSRELAIVRELWQWREEQAHQQNRPPRRVLRDDLIVELARRRTADERRITAVRGFERRDLRKLVPELAARIQRALDLPARECPRPERRETSPQRAALCQFLSAVLCAVCKDARISPGLLGNTNDVRDLVGYHLGERAADLEPPALATGWRAQVVGPVIDDLLAGRITVRVADANAEQPLALERTTGAGPAAGDRRLES
jgi:ribonuclease D